MKEEDKQFLIELRELLDKYDMTISLYYSSVEEMYDECLEISRKGERCTEEIIFKTDNSCIIGAFNLPKE